MAFQVSVFLENKIGHLERITNVLRAAGINIRAMTLSHSTQGWGILNLIVSNPQLACETLSDNKFSATLREIAVIEMEDHPGGLDDLLKKIAAAEINFTNAYGRIVSPGKTAYLAIDVEDIGNCLEKLKRAGLKLIPDNDVYGNGNH
ncbi:MAG TPA: hypothetical protein DCY97_10480 [Marinilabiliales bacterium]|nr:hypothetical protein [Marinilabiliales bacterium]